MSSVLLDCNSCLGSCGIIVGVLLCLVLAASVIVTAIYQVKSYYKLKDIEVDVEKLNK